MRELAAAALLLAACAGGAAAPGVPAAPHAPSGEGLEVTVGPDGAVVVDRRRVVVPAAGELRFAGVAPRLDLASLVLDGAPAVSQRLEGSTLIWQVRGARPGPSLVTATYRTPGLSWHAATVVVLDEDGADVSARVEIENRSGASFPAARVRLAGAPAGAPHLADVPGRFGLPAGQVTSLPLLPGPGASRRVPARRTLVFDAIGAAGVWNGPELKKERGFPATTTHEVRAFVEVANDAGAGLGVALPAGVVRFFRRGYDGTLRWLADQPVDEVAVGRHLRVALGVDAELRGTRRSVSVDVDDERRHLVEEVEIELSNRSIHAREVTVIERLARSDHWRLTWWSAEPDKDDSRSARFVVTVPANGQTKFRYRVMYSW